MFREPHLQGCSLVRLRPPPPPHPGNFPASMPQSTDDERKILVSAPYKGPGPARNDFFLPHAYTLEPQPLRQHWRVDHMSRTILDMQVHAA